LPPIDAARLAAQLPDSICPVGVFFEPNDEELATVMRVLPGALIQLHGEETPNRVAEIRTRFKCRVIKAIAIANDDDVAGAKEYERVADWLLFDAKAPKNHVNALPGGNALAFDWKLLGARDWHVPWLLSGGLSADNLAEAVMLTKARAVDVSSGVEDSPGHKNPSRIRAFLAAARAI
jgi:phosphoribosylanthranilate isomerase